LILLKKNKTTTQSNKVLPVLNGGFDHFSNRKAKKHITRISSTFKRSYIHLEDALSKSKEMENLKLQYIFIRKIR